MELSRTPRLSDPNRLRYEQAVSEGDNVRRLNIELDTLISRAQSAILNPDVSTDAFSGFNAAVMDIMQQAVGDTTASFTDFHRLMINGNFSTERVIMPLLFGNNSKRVRQMRRRDSNGIEGKSIEMIENLLGVKNRLSRSKSARASEEFGNVKGALQEDTAAALLNYRQDGDFIVLPPSLEEDLQDHTDLNAYFIAQDGNGYHVRISIKSSAQKAAEEKLKHPHLVVLAARDFHNEDFKISRLLSRSNAGFPGVSDAEQALIDTARRDVYETFLRQVDVIPATPLPAQPSELLRQVLENVA